MDIINSSDMGKTERHGLFVNDDDYNHSIFVAENNSDGLKDKWLLLAEHFKKAGVKLGYADDPGVLFELHLNVHAKVAEASRPAYVILLEDSHVFLQNGDEHLLSKYKKVFTWNDDLVDNKRYYKISFSPRVETPPVDGLANRPDFCCVIAGNKSLPRFSNNDLYRERVNAIRWFEKHAPMDFSLYGGGWELPPKLPGLWGSLKHRAYKIFGYQRLLTAFPSWKGRVERKKDILMSTRFTIAYENVSGVPGYITEKIFDAFSSGCVPVYWGASNITDYIPEGCFIDMRNFQDMNELYSFLKHMSEEDYLGYQESIRSFLESDAAYFFSPDCFADTICSTIIADIED